MARGLNKVLLIGHLGADPEVRFTPNGTAVADVRLATSQIWKDKGGQPQERTEWHRLVFWRRLAEIAGQYLRRGSQVYVEGQLTTRSWEDESGQKRQVTEVVVRDLQLLDGRGLPDQDATGELGEALLAGATLAGATLAGATLAGAGGEDEDDGLPF